MSNLVFPYYLVGLNFTDSKIPIGGSTGLTRSVAGQVSAIAKSPWPRWRWKISWEWLDDTVTRTNLLRWSQDFSQGWTRTANGTGVAPQLEANYVGNPAPDGTYTADRLFFNLNGGTTGSDYSRLLGAAVTGVPGQVYTFSIWMRTVSGTAQVLIEETDQSAWASTVTVTPVWQRFQVSSNVWLNLPQTVINFNVFLRGTFGTSDTVDLLLWGAQLETGTVATPYIPTGAAGATVSDAKTLAGFVNSMTGQGDTFLWLDPDFNTVTQQAFFTGDGSTTTAQLVAQYSTDGASLGSGGKPDIVQNLDGGPAIYVTRFSLPELMSPALRTNLLLQSQTLATTWSTDASTPTNGVSVAPDQTNTACTIKETVTNTFHSVHQTVTVPAANEDISFTAYVEANLSRTLCWIELFDSTSNVTVWFNLSGFGSVGTVQTGSTWRNVRATIAVARNNFYRITVTANKASAATSITAYIGPTTTDGLLGYAGNVANGITAWGLQLEVGSNPTMYLPTTTATVSATDYTIGANGIVSFTAAPAVNATLSWTGSFFYRARFTSDEPLDLAEFANRMWDASSNTQIEFESEFV